MFGSPHTPKTKTMKIRFMKSPTGAYKLAYNIGQVVEVEAAGLNSETVNELLKLKFVEKVNDKAVDLTSLDRSRLKMICKSVEVGEKKQPIRHNINASKWDLIRLIIRHADDVHVATVAEELGYVAKSKKAADQKSGRVAKSKKADKK